MRYIRFAFAFFSLFSVLSFGEAAPRGISYLSPVPGARWVRPETGIIIRSATAVRASALDPSLFAVSGSLSGIHRGRCVLSDDGRTVIFQPDAPFQAGEDVTVSVQTAFLDAGVEATPLALHFSIAPKVIPVDPMASLRRELDDPQAGASWDGPEETSARPVPMRPADAGADTLPLDFPFIDAQTYDQTAAGRVFMCNIGGAAGASSYLMILENSGLPFFYRKTLLRGLDFKVQQNGLLTYFEWSNLTYYALNNFYDPVDSFRCGNGYSTDIHELQLLPNGHALLLSYDPQVVDMSALVANGYPQATVTGLVIQELDKDKNVVFQWRSWDHFNILDATHEDFTATTIDYVHGNAVTLDYDGTILLSSRHMDEITKINRETGDIVWRFGGKHNEFTFLNDSIGFSHQHDIRRLPNGDVTFFDNGNYHQPQFSRAVEYRLDEQQKTATLVWQYRNNPDIYGFAMGDVQRLDNGNTFIGWGTGSTATEVRPDGSKVFELKLAKNVYSYRAFRFAWQPDILYKPTDVPAGYGLDQNYPNPFNSATLIPIALPEAADVSLRVYDGLGREVDDLFEGRQRPGLYVARFNAANLASGLYYYRLQARSAASPDQVFTETKKLLLVR